MVRPSRPTRARVLRPAQAMLSTAALLALHALTGCNIPAPSDPDAAATSTDAAASTTDAAASTTDAAASTTDATPASGDAAVPAVDATIPALRPPPVEDSDLVLDPVIGIARARGRLLVMLAPDADAARTVPALMAAAPAATVILGGAPRLALIVLGVPDDADVTAARDAIAAVPGVRVAVEDWAMAPTSLFPLPDAAHALPRTVALGGAVDWTWETTPRGDNWWLEATRMPGAWSWNDAIARSERTTTVGVLDVGGIMTEHPELAGVATNGADARADEHATSIAGILAARFDDRAGMNGTSPYVRVVGGTLHRRGTNRLLTFGTAVLESLDELLAHAAPRVVNISLGFPWAEPDSSFGLVPVAPDARIDQQRLVRESGEIAAQLAGLLALSDPPTFLVAAAGNSAIPPADIEPTLDEDTRDRLHTWARPDARWTSPFCYAALALGAANVYCVEALSYREDGARVRAPFSNVHGTISAPGVRVLSTTTCDTPGCAAGGAGYARHDGTSLAAPIVAGLIGHMLAFNPRLDVGAVRTALLSTAQPTQDGAPAVNAFAAMRALPRGDDDATDPLRALFDVDDGTRDGLDLTTAADARGDGRVDARDFRRVRDSLLWDLGVRDHILATPNRDAKLDHNRDGRLDDASPEVWSRMDFDGDGLLGESDLDALGASPVWSDPAMPGAALRGLLRSGDLVLDPAPLFADGAPALDVRADGAPYGLHIEPGDAGPIVYTVPAGASTLRVTTTGGRRVAEYAFSIAAGEDQRLTLTTLSPVTCAPGTSTLLAGHVGNAHGDPIAGAVVTVSNVPGTPSTLTTTTDGLGNFRLAVPATAGLQVTVGCRVVYTSFTPARCVINTVPAVTC